MNEQQQVAKRKPTNVFVELPGATVELNVLAGRASERSDGFSVTSAAFSGEPMFGQMILDAGRVCIALPEASRPLLHYAYVASLLAAHEAQIAEAFRSLRKPK